MKKFLPLIREHLLTLLLVLTPIPFLLFVWHYFSLMPQLEAIHDRLNILHEKTVELTKQKEKNAFYITKMKKSEPQYLEKRLESLNFSALTSSDNQLVFQEENPIRSELFEETQVKMKYPLLLNEEELKTVLGRIESHADEAAPQLLFKQFKLSKKMTENEEELFELSFELLKRELIKN